MSFNSHVYRYAKSPDFTTSLPLDFAGQLWAMLLHEKYSEHPDEKIRTVNSKFGYTLNRKNTCKYLKELEYRYKLWISRKFNMTIN